MKLANIEGRMALVGPRGVADLGRASDGRLPSSPREVLEDWQRVRAAAHELAVTDWEPLDPVSLRSPIPTPRQSIGVGLNYRDHAAEANWELPTIPLLFSKLPGCLSGPHDDIALPSDAVDWEVELVVVIGAHADRVPESKALEVVAGYSVGQDISERRVQRTQPGPQLTLAKSYRTFGPWGPVIATLDEFADPNDLAISCDLNGERVQESRTSELIFSVPELISFITARMPLWPGDLIFTGTPAGIGSVRTPPRYLAPDDVLESTVEGVGALRNVCRAAPPLP